MKTTAEPDPNYFDYAATCPPWPEAQEEHARISLEFFGNPSSVHGPGTKARTKLLELRKQFCDLAGMQDGRVLQCASASEANCTIIEGHLRRFPQGKLLIAEDVHDSIWYALKNHQKSSEVLRIGNNGIIDTEAFRKAAKKGITLVCMSHVCHETGVIQPVAELADITGRLGIRTLIDGVQAIGNMKLNLAEIPCTYYTFSGHKFGAPKGTGGVFIRDGEFEPQVRGGKQQWGLRAGTDDVAGLASMVVSLQKSLEDLNVKSQKIQGLRSQLIQRLATCGGVQINSKEDGMTGILSISFRGSSGHELVGALSIHGYALSTGAACQANQVEPSRILLAMGRSHEEAIGALRISLGRGNTIESVDILINAILEIVD